MRIAILSDTHSRYTTVATVLQELRDRGVSFVVHCGDIEDATTVGLFDGFTAHFVYGNCDMNRDSLRLAAHHLGATFHEPYGSLELEGVRLAFVHGDDKRLLQELEESGRFDFLFHGHTHHAEEHRTGPTRVINPGALHRARPKSFVILDLKSRVVETVSVG